jgi:hypothetical protein
MFSVEKLSGKRFAKMHDGETKCLFNDWTWDRRNQMPV